MKRKLYQEKISKENHLFICLYGVRYIGGVSFIRGHFWNKGMLYADIKEKQQVKELTSLLSMRHTVAD